MEIEQLVGSYDPLLPPERFQAWRRELEQKINHLINTDFDTLVQLLYRIDIDEKKLRAFLGQPEKKDAAIIISDMIMDRLQQKQASRRRYRSDDNIPPEDKW